MYFSEYIFAKNRRILSPMIHNIMKRFRIKSGFCSGSAKKKKRKKNQILTRSRPTAAFNG